MNSAVMSTSSYVDTPEDDKIIAGILEQISNTLRKTSESQLLKKAALDVLPSEDILSHPDFNPALLEKLKQDQKLQRLEGMLKGSRNFVHSQEKRSATPYSPPERMELFLKNLRTCLPSLYAQKAPPKGPAMREAKVAETLAPILFANDPRALEEAAFLDQLFLRGALADLILGRAEHLDPVTGDAACQLRAPFIVDARLETMNFLEAEKVDVPQLAEWVREFCAANGLNKMTGALPPVQTLRLRWQPERPELNHIFSKLLGHLQNTAGKGGKIDTTSFLALAKALTLTQDAEVDAFGLPVARHTSIIYRDSRELDKRKTGLASLTRDYILNMTELLASSPNEVNPALAPMLQASLQKSEAYLPLGKGQKLPCLPMYSGLRTVLLYEEMQGRPLVIYLKRLGFQKDPGFQKVKGIPRLNSPFAALDQETRHSLIGAEVFYLLPRAGGGFELADQPDDLAANRPALCIDAWSMIDLDNPAPKVATTKAESDLYSPDYQTYRAAFLKSNILGLILAAAAAHAPLPTVARSPEHPEGWSDCGRAYNLQLLRDASAGGDKALPSEPAAIEKILAGGKLAPVSLAEEYEQLLDYLQSRDQFELIYSQPETAKGLSTKLFDHRRIKRNVPFTPIHIHASTFAAKQSECRALEGAQKEGMVMEGVEDNKLSYAGAKASELVH
jgi:hypothetical protein